MLNPFICKIPRRHSFHSLSLSISANVEKLNHRYSELSKYSGHSPQSKRASGCILCNALPPLEGLKASFPVILADPITVTRGISQCAWRRGWYKCAISKQSTNLEAAGAPYRPFLNRIESANSKSNKRVPGSVRFGNGALPLYISLARTKLFLHSKCQLKVTRLGSFAQRHHVDLYVLRFSSQ